MKHQQRRLKILVSKQREPVSSKLTNSSLTREKPKINIVAAESFTQ